MGVQYEAKCFEMDQVLISGGLLYSDLSSESILGLQHVMTLETYMLYYVTQVHDTYRC